MSKRARNIMIKAIRHEVQQDETVTTADPGGVEGDEVDDLASTSSKALSPLTLSEFGVLSRQFVKEKCLSFVENRYLKETDKEPQNPTTPVKSSRLRLVDYSCSPSATSTFQSVSNRTGKENFFGFLKPSTTSSPDKGAFGVPQPHIKPSMIFSKMGLIKSSDGADVNENESTNENESANENKFGNEDVHVNELATLKLNSCNQTPSHENKTVPSGTCLQEVAATNQLQNVEIVESRPSATKCRETELLEQNPPKLNKSLGIKHLNEKPYQQEIKSSTGEDKSATPGRPLSAYQKQRLKNLAGSQEMIQNVMNQMGQSACTVKHKTPAKSPAPVKRLQRVKIGLSFPTNCRDSLKQGNGITPKQTQESESPDINEAADVLSDKCNSLKDFSNNYSSSLREVDENEQPGNVSDASAIETEDTTFVNGNLVKPGNNHNLPELTSATGRDKSATPGRPLSAYQQQRLKNVAENKEMFQNLMSQMGQSDSLVKHKTPYKSTAPAKRLEKAKVLLSSPIKRRESLKRSCRITAKQTQESNGSDTDESADNFSTKSLSLEDLTDGSSTSSTREVNDCEEPDDDILEESANETEDSIPANQSLAEPDEDSGDLTEASLGVEGATPKRKKKEVMAEIKLLKNTGQSYVAPTGKVVSARKCTPSHTCNIRKCHINITPEVGQQIFDEYWQQGNHDKRVSYVAARLESGQVQRKRLREDFSNREKEISYKYYFDVNGKRIQVCRSTFLNTLGETDRFVRTVAENKAKSVTGITKDDSRGRHPPPHAMKPSTIEHVQNHIRSFPAYVSHYCRAQSNMLYLPSDLTVAKMHLMYLEDGNPSVSYNFYLKEFNKSGRKFHAPKSDGCDKCDKLETAIKCASDEEATNLRREKELHQRKAEKAYFLKKEAKKEALQQKDKKRVLVFDLQQCLPTPYLQCKKIYYSRQLYVYNFTIHDCVTNLTYCYMWDQVEGRRGSNELASCLLQHILTEIPDGVEVLKMFSDCCSGQNRNHVMSMMLFAALQEHPTLKTIQHFFMVPGHTFMPEVDSKHSVIEKYKKKHLERVNVPAEWYQAVEDAGKTMSCPEGKFRVFHKTEFYDISALAKTELVKRSTCSDKDSFSYLSTHIFLYEKKALGIVKVKSSFNEEAPYRELSFLRKGTRSDRLPRLVPKLQVLGGNVPVSKEKKKDLLNLLDYLDVQHHAFYKTLPVEENDVPDTHPDFMNEIDPDELSE
ncbi:Death-associated inhibitor of apoptosis 2 [Frankliniella fusca]|uniref:Death-associated inhibitor of apoptosis 2 n=2 Tax=Frankliniella fusca TaxID=407009 RepID=A0AAE1HLB0_9NEOP|nr:Death-associated inhibitor of apoptosis 2 [Frankliniella fusca]